jgi:capsular polysaccharide biosynthesis protein
VNDPEYSIAWPDGVGGRHRGPSVWVEDDFLPAGEYPSADVTGEPASLKFIAAALRRRARVWCAVGAIGLVGACGFYFKSPPSYQASASVLLTPGPYEDANTAPNDDQAMAQSRTVAGMAVGALGLQEDVGKFLNSYTALAITERVMRITIAAGSSDQAVLRANAVARAFLQFRASQMQAEQKLVLVSLNQQVSQEQQLLDSINAQISQLGPNPSGPSADQLTQLKAQRTQATALLGNLQQAVYGNQTTTEPATAAAVKGSFLLDAATPLAHSRLKPLLRDAAEGLVGGLAVGMAIVVIQALVSERLRRRDDVAQAIGAPVKLSVRAARRRPWRRRAADGDIERVAAHLGRSVPGSSRGAAALAIIPVDDLRIPALSVVSLATLLAKQGKQVVVADLCAGAPAAKILGSASPGVRAVHAVHAGAAGLVVAVPEPGVVAPAGPLDHGAVPAQRTTFTEAVITACAPADLLLTLTTLDPALGGEHLATWATDAVAVVTAGESSSTKIHAVGEMVRLSGARLNSAVLLGADAADESLGMTYLPETV